MSLDQVKNIVLVLSGKGGVGKSSVTVQLALSLCLAGRNVGILDVDLTGPSIPRLLGIESSAIKQAPGGWLPVEVHAAQQLPPLDSPTEAPRHGDHATGTESNGAAPHSSPQAAGYESSPTRTGSLHAMSLAFLLPARGSAVVWRGPKKTAMVRQFLADVLWPPLDYLLVDTPPGTSDEHISLVETLLKNTQLGPSILYDPDAPEAATTTSETPPSTTTPSKPLLAGALLVTTPQAVATADVRKELSFCRKTALPVLGVVENMSGFVCPCCGAAAALFSRGGGRVMAREWRVPFAGEVAVDPAWGALVEGGRRPVYGAAVSGGAQEEVDSDSEDEGGGGGRVEEDKELVEPVGKKEEEPREPGLLVDKYRSCALCPVFAEIAKKVVQRAESGTAAKVQPPSA